MGSTFLIVFADRIEINSRAILMHEKKTLYKTVRDKNTPLAVAWGSHTTVRVQNVCTMGISELSKLQEHKATSIALEPG
jgi:hypothetical protein